MKEIKYATREEWLAARRHILTSTDVGAIVGVSKWASASSVFASKVAGMEGEENEHMVVGRSVQPGIAAAYQTIRMLRNPDEPVDIVNIDGHALFFTDDGRHGTSLDCLQTIGTRGIGVLEIKATSGFPEEPYDEWVTQVQWQMYVTGCEYGTIAALCGGTSMRFWDITPDVDLIEPLKVAADAFWAQHVLSGVPPAPDGSDSARRAVRSMFPTSIPGTEVTLTVEDLDAVMEIQAAKEAIDAYRKRADALEDGLKLKMGNAETAYLPNGWKLTWKSSERKGYYVQPAQTRTFRIVVPKP
jgi:predicted phage-related endonuclease